MLRINAGASSQKLQKALALLIALAFLAAVVSPSDAAQKIIITVPAMEAEQGSFFIALKKGYFAAEGLDVELQEAGGGTATPALLSGSIQGSASAASAISAILRGAALRVVAVFQDTLPYDIWAQPDIRTLADLKGKAVGVATRGDTFEIATRLVLQGAGISPDSVGYTPIGFGSTAGAALETGALPAVVLSHSQGLFMRDKGQLKNAHVLTALMGKVRMPYAGFVMSEKTLYGDPALAKRILRAIVKGIRYEKAFKQPTIDILQSYQKDINTRATLISYDDFTRTSTRDLTAGSDLITADLAVRAHLLNIPDDKLPPVEKIYDFALVRAINAELDASRWKPTR